MMAALDAGDEGLAQQYAEQFQRYTEKLQRSNLTAVNLLSGVAREKELAARAQLDSERAKLSIPQKSVKQGTGADGQEGTTDAAVSMEGKVQVFFFFSSNDANSGAAAREVEQIASLAQSDSRIQVVGVAADMMGSQAALAFKQRYELSFPVIADTPLANSMGVQVLPSTVLVTPANQRQELKAGLVKAAELKQAVKDLQRGGVPQ
jgi:peroxiredoxin